MTRQGLEILWRISSGHRVRYMAAAAALILASVLGYGPPLVIKYTIDNVIGGQQPQGPGFFVDIAAWLGGREHLARNLWIAALTIAMLTAAAGLFTYLRGRWAAYASEGMTRRLRDALYDRLGHLPCTFHDRNQTGDLVQRCTSDVEMVRLFLSTHLVELVRAIVMVAVALPIMLMLDWRMTLAATCLLPIVALFSLVFFVLVRGSFTAVEEAEGALTTRLQENLTGVRVVRAFARQSHGIDIFAERNEKYRAAHMHLYKVLAIFWAMSDLLVFAQMALVLFIGAYLVMLGPAAGGITVGTLIVMLSYVTVYIWPVRQMGRILAELSKAIVSVRRIAYILAEPPETDPPAVAPAPQLSGRVEFRDVVFAHGEGAPPVLRGVSFTVEPGQTLAILGPSGSGKSTIVNLLLRLYEYTGGSIMLDGRELRDLPRKAIRAQVGAVMQEPFLYSRTLRENIALGAAGVEHDQIVEASVAACVHESIEAFEAKYDTLIGERGITLSGGQRQRVALARALVRRPPILLLDDALSAVDTRTESMILRALRQRHGRQTTIVIAHRLTTLMHADKVIVIEGGRVTAAGTHADLIAADGLYRRLWELQSSAGEPREPAGAMS
jgi:ATP-binding cassette, subfamily B, bacterial